MSNQPNPLDQHDSEFQLVLTIGIEGFRELVAWVAEGDTGEDRYARGSQVREVTDDVVKNVDSAKINQALLERSCAPTQGRPTFAHLWKERVLEHG